MSQITSPATYSISRPQDVIDIVNKNSAINTSIGVIFIALGYIIPAIVIGVLVFVQPFILIAITERLEKKF